MSGPRLAAAISVIADILSLCSSRPDLAEFAQDRLNEIVVRMVPPIQPKKRAEEAIHGHMVRMASQEGIILQFPSRSELRSMAERLAKWHKLPFNPKELKKKDQVLDWLGKNWDKAETGLYLMMDHSNRVSQNRS
jgi:hypothetical protein